MQCPRRITNRRAASSELWRQYPQYETRSARKAERGGSTPETCRAETRSARLRRANRDQIALQQKKRADPPIGGDYRAHLICIKWRIAMPLYFSVFEGRSSGMKTLRTLGIFTSAVLMCATPVSLHWSPVKAPSLSVDTASARVGRPLTPVSVAGVHRRAYRRAAYGGGYYGGGAGIAAAGAVAAGAAATGAYAGYPPATGAYAGYPPATGVYAGYPPATGVYAGYPPATGVYAGYPPATGAYAPPATGAYAPAATGAYAPAATGAYVPAATGAYAGYPASAPAFVNEAVQVEPGLSATVTDPATGRRCTISTSGRHWCWTP